MPLSATHRRLVVLGLIILTAPAGASAQSDWDLYALRLINRARANPAAEAAIIGSSYVDNRAPVPPLALHRLVCQAATNHVHWMHDNLGSIDSDVVPDSWTLYECLDGDDATIPAVGTPSFTGVTWLERMTAVGFPWYWVAETASAIATSDAIPIDKLLIESQHRMYWDNPGMRYVILNCSPKVYGQHYEGRPFMPPRGGLVAPNDNLLYTDILFASKRTPHPPHYIVGLIFSDRDGSGDWTPRDDSDASREGLAGVPCTVYAAGTATVVTTDTTMENGAFSLNVNPGTYDLVLTLPNQTLRIDNVVVNANVDVGDVEVLGSDEFFHACFAGPGAQPDPHRLGYTDPTCFDSFDADHDLDIDLMDFAAYARSAVAPPIPGDGDGDGDIDLDDLTLFTGCLTGPVGALAGCESADLNDDGHADLSDFYAWQRLFASAR